MAWWFGCEETGCEGDEVLKQFDRSHGAMEIISGVGFARLSRGGVHGAGLIRFNLLLGVSLSYGTARYPGNEHAFNDTAFILMAYLNSKS